MNEEQQIYFLAWIYHRISVVHKLRYDSPSARVIEQELLNGAVALTNTLNPSVDGSLNHKGLPDVWLTRSIEGRPLITDQLLPTVKLAVTKHWKR